MSQLATYDLIKDGESLISFKSFILLDVTAEAKTTQQAIEEGSFTSINKVLSPKTYSVELGLEGDESDIRNAITTIETELTEATLLQIVYPLGATPEATLTKYSYSQNLENGYGRLLLKLSLEEIKQVETQYSSTDTAPITSSEATNASDVSNTDSGLQQTTETRQSVLSKLMS